LNQLINAVGAGMQPHPLAKIFLERNWLDLGEFDWIWVKIGKIKANFGQV